MRMLQLLYVSSIFACFMSAITSGLNIMAQAFDQNDFPYLGNTSIFLIFTFGIAGNILCKNLYHLGVNFFIHSIGYLLFLSSGILVCYCASRQENQKSAIWIVTITTSAISGFASSGLFVTQNNYIAKISPPEKITLYYGIGWAVLQLSQIIGALYSTFLIEQLGQLNFFIMITIISVGCSLCFLFTKEPQNSLHIQVSVTEDLEKTSNQEELEQIPSLNNLVQLITDKDVMTLILPMLATGVLLSFQWNILFKLIESSIDTNQAKEVINKLTFQIIISVGFMEFAGGLISGLVNLDLGYKQQLLFQSIQIAIILSVLNLYLQKYALNYVIGSIWGFVDCATTSTLLSIISTYWSKSVQIYALFNLLQCFGGLVSTILIMAMSELGLQWLIFILFCFIGCCKLSMTVFQYQIK